jgi:hypothetical protein
LNPRCNNPPSKKKDDSYTTEDEEVGEISQSKAAKAIKSKKKKV